MILDGTLNRRFSHLCAFAVAVVSIVLTLSACKVFGPDFVKPEAEVPQGWNDRGKPIDQLHYLVGLVPHIRDLDSARIATGVFHFFL